jgi:hypothetical protein
MIDLTGLIWIIYIFQKGKMSSLPKCVSALLIFFLLSAPIAASAIRSPDSEKKPGPVFKVKARDGEESPSQQEDFEKLLAEGKRLYLKEMDYEAALLKLKEAENLARTQKQKADVNFYLSLIFYSLWGRGGSENFTEILRNISLIDECIRKIIEFDYYRELDRFLCPPKYVEAFEAVKKEYGVLKIQSSPAGADVMLDDSRVVVGKTPLTVGHREGNVKVTVKIGKREKESALQVRAGQETGSPEYSLKKRSSFFYWVGGAALAGGSAALLLIKKKDAPEPAGTIQVYSVPGGAQVFLDDVNTGQMTNCTLAGISVGNHSVTIAKE